MTPGARISAAIECLDAIFDGTPAEKALTGWARRSRYAGSKDRAAVRDHVFDALRMRDSYAAIGGELTGRAVMVGLVHAHQEMQFDELFNDLGHSPPSLSAEERTLLESAQSDESAINIGNSTFTRENWRWDLQLWCTEKLEASHPEQATLIANALKQRAPVDLRVNKRLGSVEEAIEALKVDDISAIPCDLSPYAIRVTHNARRVKLSHAYLTGLVELQDTGSQALVDALPLKDSQKILDYCAGGGGKSLAMAAKCEASIFAHDINQARMMDIPVRTTRASAHIQCLTTEALQNHAPFDIVLCDAPCSGSGAWRRSPDAKWRVTQDQFGELLEVQQNILAKAQSLVAPSGYLAYATCSLFAEENEYQINRFLENHTKFDLISNASWTPLDGCDGFSIFLMQLKE